MQVPLEHLLIAVIGAIAIVFVLLILGLSIGYREKIEESGIIMYARIIGTPILIVVAIYFYLQGAFGSDVFFITIVWLLPVLLCADWTKLWGEREPSSERVTLNSH